MNKSLFRSWSALVAVAAAAMVAYMATRGLAPVSESLPGGRTARLVTGWSLLAAMLVVGGYLARKYMHKRGYSPEFRMRVPIAALERAQVRIAGVRRDVAKGTYADARAVRVAADHALRSEGVQKVLRVVVSPGGTGEPRFVLTTEKTFPLGRASRWIHLHLYAGVAFVILLWAHGATGLDSGLGAALLISGAIVATSGFVGIVLWAVGPAWLTRLERDLSIEEAFALDEHLVRKLDASATAIGEPLAGRVRALGRTSPDTKAATSLLAEAGADPARRLLVEDALVLAGQRARVGAELRKLTRARLAFQAWRIAHLPFVVVLTILVGLHLWTVWRY